MKKFPVSSAPAMPRQSEFVQFVVGQMRFVEGLRVRAMFGGHGIYQDDRIFAIIADDRLYFKVDATTRGEFEENGLGPFTYVARGKTMTMQYFEAPPEIFEDQEAMRSWVQKAYGATFRAEKTKRPSKKDRQA